MDKAELVELYKKRFGDGDIRFENGRMSCPPWLANLIFDLSGVRSKKWRIQKKVIQRKLMELLKRGVESEVDDAHVE